MKVRNALIVVVVAVVLAAGLGLGLARSGNPSASGAGETDSVAQKLYVEWGQVSIPISAVSGLEWTTEVNTKNVVTKEVMSIALKIPGANSYTPVTIERGITKDDTQFADWAELVETGNIGEARRDISIAIYDYEAAVVARWYFVGCWPSAYTSWFDANTMSMPMESLTLVHQGFNRVE